ncbi:MAG TPA: alcohol dehydrogenase catalytic domain-containing protein [Vicinamibacteria bacterium]|nr:alcohol dehydrogenase catalytic domain-containing protein [Vicinamibacteria bacterium]
MATALMRAAVYRGPGDLRVEEVPRPEPGPGEMVVRIEACGICGTDIKKVQKGLLAGPRIFGHEMAGVVAARGAGVTRFREGERVVLHHHIPCRRCFYCEQGAYAQCEGYKRNGTTAGFEPAGGGFAEFVKALDWIAEHGAIAVPEGVDAEEAAFVEPVNTCLKAVRRAALRPGESVVVVGQGPIGLLLTQLCRWSGAEPIVTDPLPDRREVALRLGAAVALPAGEGVPAEVRRLTGRGADVALVAALGTAALRQAIDAVRPAGRIIVFAATSPGETAEIDLGALCAAEKELLTSYSASVDVQDLAARLVFGREVRVRDLITHRFPLEQAAPALELAARPAPGVLKVMLRPDARGDAPDGSR